MQLMWGNSRYRRNGSQSKHNQRQPLGLGCTGTTSSHICSCLISQHGEAVRTRVMGDHPARMLAQVLWDALTHPQVSRKSCTVEIQIEFDFQVMIVNQVSMPTFSASLCWEHSCHNFDKQTNPVYTLAILKVLWINVIWIFTSSPETFKNL